MKFVCCTLWNLVKKSGPQALILSTHQFLHKTVFLKGPVRYLCWNYANSKTFCTEKKARHFITLGKVLSKVSRPPWDSKSCCIMWVKFLHWNILDKKEINVHNWYIFGIVWISTNLANTTFCGRNKCFRFYFAFVKIFCTHV